MSRDLSPPDYSMPSSARVNNALKGGKANYQPDRDAVAELKAMEPHLVDVVRQAVECSHRIVRALAEQGFTQFVDVGCGLPSPQGLALPDVIWRHEPYALVLNIDNDPSVLAHHAARGNPDSRARFLAGDIRDLEQLLEAPEARLLDWSRPVAWLGFLLFHFIGDDDDPAGLIDRIASRSAPGSVLAFTHVTHEHYPEPYRPEVQAIFERISPGLVTVRTVPQIEALAGGRRLWEPGLVCASEWRPDREDPAVSTYRSYAAVAQL